ncbi:MAG: GGDEF domain-containing protein [Bacilli bacterium]|nr:GGDEF domain-containing protein [Bacilli bacterium]
MAQRKISLTAKVILIVTAFLVAVDVVLGIVMINLSAKSTREVLNHKMLELAQTAAKLVNGDEIKALTVADKENNTEPYKKNYDILAAFKTSAQENGADLAFIYCLVRVSPEKIVFSIDPSDDPAIFLTEEPIYTDAMIAATYGTAGVDSQAYEDRWGKLYSAYAPVFGSDNQVAAVVGVDVWAKWYDIEITNSAIAISAIGAVTIAAGVLIALLITIRLRKRFDSLTTDMASLESDLQKLLVEIRKPTDFNPDVSSDNIRGDEIAVLKNKINIAQEEVRQYIAYSERKAYTDSLTQIGNRLAYFERVKDINNKINSGEDFCFTVLVYDVNGLKDINDTYGHESGDIALVVAADLIQKIFGVENTYRIGGDEIVIIMENENGSDISHMNDELSDQLAIFNESKDAIQTPISLSYGLAKYDKETDKEFLDVFRRADKDMYDCKNAYYKESGKRRKK